VHVNVSKLLYAPPVVVIAMPRPHDLLIYEVNITGTVTDGYGEIQTVMVRIEGGQWMKALGGRNWFFGMASEGFPYGNITFEVRASDAYATSQVQGLVLFHYRFPVLVIDDPATGTKFKETISVHGSIQYGAPGDLRLEFRTNGGRWDSLENASRNWTIEVGPEGLDPGNVRIDLRAFDGVSYSEIENVTVVFSPDPHVSQRMSNTMVIVLIIAVGVVLLAVAYMKRARQF